MCNFDFGIFCESYEAPRKRRKWLENFKEVGKFDSQNSISVFKIFKAPKDFKKSLTFKKTLEMTNKKIPQYKISLS